MNVSCLKSNASEFDIAISSYYLQNMWVPVKQIIKIAIWTKKLPENSSETRVANLV